MRAWTFAAAPGDAISGYNGNRCDTWNGFSRAADMVEQNPERLASMQTPFYAGSARYNAMPIGNMKVERFGAGTQYAPRRFPPITP